jgi:hypothetical protein
MRDKAFVRVYATEVAELKKLFLLAHEQEFPGVICSPIEELIARFDEEIINAEPQSELIESARELYSVAGDDADGRFGGIEIMVDDDASFSEANSGTWVGAWVWIPSDDEDEKEEEEVENEE